MTSFLQFTDRPTISSSLFSSSSYHSHRWAWLQTRLIMLLDGRMLSGFLMAPSILVILNILWRGTRSLQHRVSVPMDPQALCVRDPVGACWAGSVDSSLALLSQQEDIKMAQLSDCGWRLSGQRRERELKEIKIYPRVIVLPYGPSIVKVKGQVHQPAWDNLMTCATSSWKPDYAFS